MTKKSGIGIGVSIMPLHWVLQFVIDGEPGCKYIHIIIGPLRFMIGIFGEERFRT